MARSIFSIFFFIAVLSWATSANAAATLTQTPDPVYDCASGLARLTLNWSGASGPVQIRVLTPQGPALSGFESPSGTATTGEWVGDGMLFFLVNQNGDVEATLAARVECGGSPRDSYLPLEVGNIWVFRQNSRLATSTYVTWTATGRQEISGRSYVIIRIEPFGDPLLLRGDGEGRIFSYANSTETLFFDPNADGQTHSSVVTAVGVFADTITQMTPGLQLRKNTVFARGVGVAHRETFLGGGSSGGFSDSLDLVEARLAGGVRLSVPAPSVSVSAESAVLDVTGKKVTNCAIPCYFAACGVAFPYDPPGTYKPCMQSRARISGGGPGTQLVMELRDATDRVLFHSDPLGADGDERVQYVQMPLYSKPNEPVASGLYKVVARLLFRGQDVGSASYSVQVQ